MTTATRKRRKDAGVPKELSEAHKQKMRKARERKKAQREKEQSREEQVTLRKTIKSLRTGVERASREDEKAFAKLTKVRSERNFTTWLRANTVLLNSLTALRAHEQRLENEEVTGDAKAS